MVLQGALALALCITLRTDWLPLVVLAFLLRGAIVTSSTMVQAFVGDLMPPCYHGTGFGLLALALQGGTMVAAFTGGILYASGARWPFTSSLILLAVTVCATPVWVRLFVPDRGEPLVAPHPQQDQEGADVNMGRPMVSSLPVTPRLSPPQ